MEILNVPGRDQRHKVFLYTLSTCMWCRKTKNFLKDHDVEYAFVDVDHCSNEERERIREEILKKGGRLSYPVILIDDDMIINGYRESEIREKLGI